MSKPTARELQVFAACLRRSSAKEAARELGISHQTVKNHLGNLYRKLGVDCDTQAAIALGWLVLPLDDVTTGGVAATG